MIVQVLKERKTQEAIVRRGIVSLEADAAESEVGASVGDVSTLEDLWSFFEYSQASSAVIKPRAASRTRSQAI